MREADEHRVLAARTPQALDDLGDLLLCLDVNRIGCHGVYKSPGGVLLKPL
jgi:hypothetical protein